MHSRMMLHTGQRIEDCHLVPDGFFLTAFLMYAVHASQRVSPDLHTLLLSTT